VTARHLRQPRRGSILPLVAICLIALIGMLALAIDLGVLAVARTQCQNAADLGALAGVRTLNGAANNNKTASDSSFAHPNPAIGSKGRG
jgi:Flp pilus assembly protein TadG